MAFALLFYNLLIFCHVIRYAFEHQILFESRVFSSSM